MLARAFDVIREIFIDAISPDPIQSIWEWAQDNRVLSSETSAEYGKYNPDRTPYLKEIGECLSPNNEYEEVVVIKGTQLGCTELGNNWIGYIIDRMPGPIQLVLQDEQTVKDTSQLRIDPMIKDCPVLRKKVKNKKDRDGDNTVKRKGFPGGFLRMVTAGSAGAARTFSIRNLMLDEIDGYPVETKDGCPVKLQEKRTKTFGSKKKIYKISSPGIDSVSKIMPAFEAGDQRHLNVPCPHCNHLQELEFKNMIYESEDGKLTDYNVTFKCANDECGVLIEEKHKTWMLANWTWIPRFPGNNNGTIASFILPTFYSPLGWHSWADIAKEFLEATYPQVQPELLRIFVNTILAETWKEKGEAPDWKRLRERRTKREPGKLPSNAGPLILTMGVDVQQNRLEAEIVAWTRKRENFSVDYIVMPGDTSDQETWRQLEEVIERTYEYNHNGNLYDVPISMTLIDSQYIPDEVYDFCRGYLFNRVAPSKGEDSLRAVLGIPIAVDIEQKGKKIKRKRRGIMYWPIGVSTIKTRVYGWLRLNAPSENEPVSTGYCHFPNYGQEYFKQLTSEELRKIRKKNGQVRLEWHRLRRNEVLDCRVMAYAAAEIKQVSKKSEEDWDKIESEMGQPIKIKKKAKGKKSTKRCPPVEAPADPPQAEFW